MPFAPDLVHFEVFLTQKENNRSSIKVKALCNVESIDTSVNGNEIFDAKVSSKVSSTGKSLAKEILDYGFLPKCFVRRDHSQKE